MPTFQDFLTDEQRAQFQQQVRLPDPKGKVRGVKSDNLTNISKQEDDEFPVVSKTS